MRINTTTPARSDQLIDLKRLALLLRHGGQGMYGDKVHAAVLADRVFAQECELYPEVVGRLAREILQRQ